MPCRSSLALLRALAASVLAAAALGVQAQPQALRPDSTRAEREWLEGVHSALNHRDCKLAVSRLNEGLEQRYPDAFLLAGAMFEQGLCVKAQWDRAATLYQRALAAGHRGGRYRLVAGLAERDPAVALWWLQDGDGASLPAACRAPSAVHRDAEAYAAMVAGWPAGRLAACAYLAGVSAAISGELEYPGDALGMLIEGRILMQFLPAEGRIDWRTAEVTRLEDSGLLRGEQVALRDGAKARDVLRRYLDELGQRALARFKRPAGIAPDWRVDTEYGFQIR